MQPLRMQLARVAVLLLVSLATITIALAEEAGLSSWSRLKSLPLARREALAEKLKEFAALPRDRQQAVRDLDARIAILEPADRDRYLSLLRRYHVWLQEQPESERASFGQGTAEERIQRVAKIQAKTRPASDGRAPRTTIEPTDLLGRSPFELALLIKTWQVLTDEQRSQVEGPKGGVGIAARSKKLADLGKQLKIDVERPSEVDSERFRRRAAEAAFTREFTANGARFDRVLEKVAEKQTTAAKAARPLFKNIVGHLGDAFWLAENHRPVRVDQANLNRFEDMIPDWLRETFDALPPDDSRLRLALIYRLAYPAGTEMPPSKAPAKGPLLPTPAAPKSTDGVAF